MSALPFNAPLGVNAQSNETPSSTPVCEFEINKNIPGQFCVPKTVIIKPGDSNNTTEQKKRAEELKKQRQKKLVAARLASSQASLERASTEVTQAIKLYRDAGQCIPFARNISGIQVSGAARTVPVNSSDPKPGSVMISYESGPGHAAVVTAVHNDSFEVIERNFYRGWVSKRVVQKSARFIKGFVAPNS